MRLCLTLVDGRNERAVDSVVDVDPERGLLERRPRSRYAWLARTRLETQVENVVVDAAQRLVELCQNDRDPSAAAATLVEVLADRGAPVEAETDALVEELLPAREVTGHASA